MIHRSAVARVRFYSGNCFRLVSRPWKQKGISIGEASTVFGSSFGPTGWHHIRKTLEEYDENPLIDFRDTTLYRFLKGFRPTSICDLIDSSAKRCNLPLFVYPWGTYSRRGIEASKSPLDSRFCGPSSELFISDEFQQILRLYCQLWQTGYRPWSHGNGFIQGVFLYRLSGQRRFIVLQGNHRLAILAHLGVEKVQVRSCPGHVTSVREADLERWPLVVEGSCDRGTARDILNLYFNNNGNHILRRI